MNRKLDEGYYFQVMKNQLNPFNNKKRKVILQSVFNARGLRFGRAKVGRVK